MNDHYNSDIAIIGMSGRFPGAHNITQFWDNLSAGYEGITFFSEQELMQEGIAKDLTQRSDYVPAKGILQDIEWFDADYFNITPLEATILDPQQRALLECAIETFETAGYVPHTFQDRVGVFVAGSLSHYLIKNILPNIHQLPGCDEYQILLGNDKDFLATRISHKLNLKGPSLTIQTACSSSLVCVHTACQSILNGECEMALAGGVSITLPQKDGYIYKKDMIASKDGHCYPFDERAQGTVKGNGLGLVLLKPLSEAIKDHDSIYAVIKGSAINNDGAHKMAFTAPSVEQQAAVIQEALMVANVPAQTIDYIETHGTGTALGDPVEMTALSRVFKSVKDHRCAIASLKSNIGHLDTAAGIAGLIKVCLALTHQKIPATINFSKLNPKITLQNTPFFINDQLLNWNKGKDKRRAGLSAFGVGGTNVHMILEEAPSFNQTVSAVQYHLLPISAKNLTALTDYIKLLLTFLKAHPDMNIADIAYTLQTGRQMFTYRECIIATNLKDAIDQLENIDIPSQTDTHYQELCQMWKSGHDIEWDKLYPDSKPYKVALPTYAWQKKHYWVEAQKQQTTHVVMSDDIATIWKNVLGVNEINPNDNFFNLGGNSLTAIQFIHSLSQELQEIISVITLYEYPTLKALMAYSNQHQQKKTSINDQKNSLESELFSQGEIL